MRVKDVNWISIAAPSEPLRAEIKIRNKHARGAGHHSTRRCHHASKFRFDDPQRAVTPGQGAVFYSGELVLGGGWIE